MLHTASNTWLRTLVNPTTASGPLDLCLYQIMTSALSVTSLKKLPHSRHASRILICHLANLQQDANGTAKLHQLLYQQLLLAQPQPHYHQPAQMVQLNTGIVMFAHTNVQMLLDHHSSLNHSAIQLKSSALLVKLNGTHAFLNQPQVALHHVLLAKDLL
jgi:hypothetical protein